MSTYVKDASIFSTTARMVRMGPMTKSYRPSAKTPSKRPEDNLVQMSAIATSAFESVCRLRGDGQEMKKPNLGKEPRKLW